MFEFNIFEKYAVVFEIFIENKLVNKQTMEAPKEMLIANFIQTAKQIEYDKRPIKIRMSRPEVIWDKFENKQKILENEIVCSNNAMIAWEGNKQSEAAK